MARIRTIKPEFWTSEQIVECSPMARLLFIGLWNFCDDAGIHPANARTIKMRVFPGDDLDTENVRRMLVELSSKGLIRLYEVEGVEYLMVTGWGKHQRVEHPSFKFPKPTKDRCADDNHSSNARRTLVERSPPEGNGRDVEGKGEEGKEQQQHLPSLPRAREAVAAAAAAPLENQPEGSQPPPKLEPPASQPANEPSEAARIVQAFDTAIAGAFGAEQARPWPSTTDLVTARRWVADGCTVETAEAVFAAICQRMAASGQQRPQTLRYCDAAIREAMVGKPVNGASGANEPRGLMALADPAVEERVRARVKAKAAAKSGETK